MPHQARYCDSTGPTQVLAELNLGMWHATLEEYGLVDCAALRAAAGEAGDDGKSLSARLQASRPAMLAPAACSPCHSKLLTVRAAGLVGCRWSSRCWRQKPTGWWRQCCRSPSSSSLAQRTGLRPRPAALSRCSWPSAPAVLCPLALLSLSLGGWSARTAAATVQACFSAIVARWVASCQLIAWRLAGGRCSACTSAMAASRQLHVRRSGGKCWTTPQNTASIANGGAQSPSCRGKRERGGRSLCGLCNVAGWDERAAVGLGCQSALPRLEVQGVPGQLERTRRFDVGSERLS